MSLAAGLSCESLTRRAELTVSLAAGLSCESMPRREEREEREGEIEQVADGAKRGGGNCVV